MADRTKFGKDWTDCYEGDMLQIENLFLQLILLSHIMVYWLPVPQSHSLLWVDSCEILTVVLPPAAHVQESMRWQKRGSHCRRPRSPPRLWWCQKHHRPASHLRLLLENKNRLHVHCCILYSTLTLFSYCMRMSSFKPLQFKASAPLLKQLTTSACLRVLERVCVLLPGTPATALPACSKRLKGVPGVLLVTSSCGWRSTTALCWL